MGLLKARQRGEGFERLRAAQVAALYGNATIAVAGAAAAAVILASTLVGLNALEQAVGIAWVAYILGCAAAHLALRFAYSRASAPDQVWRVWAFRFTLVCLAEGVGWGWASAFLVAPDHFDLEMLVIVVSLTIAGASIPVFGSYIPSFLSMFLPTTLACLIWSEAARSQLPQATAMFWLMMIFIVAMGALGLRANRNFNELVNLRIRASELAADLRRQKELAEQANLAKSSFLAAASHDLRQPVHALGLFAGALRSAGIPSEAMVMVEHIEASAAAMDSLFSALLDISKLDAGIVDVQRHSFPIQPVIDRICREYTNEATIKGVNLSKHHCSAVIYTDPILLERVVRNLVSNAVKYTEKGRIIIGCRRRAGAISIQVLDTGQGIAPNLQERIFQEYFQVQNPERDRTKGLGLGLAIVRRLTNLLDCKLELQSAPGKGSCFKLAVPLAAGPADYLEQQPGDTPDQKSEGFIVVVDDEVAIRAAMNSLLSSWGFTVIAAASGDDIVAELALCSVRPDLIICDYRLRSGENGIAVIERLQSEYNEAIPAMLITGDTAEDRLIEAQASGFLLLHKPVANSRLRASISSLMAAACERREAGQATIL
jgi:two-component system, sensor histidine kinase